MIHMNWITTNIRLPEDVYMQLKMQAARERKSVAGVIREKLAKDKKQVATHFSLKKSHKNKKEYTLLDLAGLVDLKTDEKTNFAQHVDDIYENP